MVAKYDARKDETVAMFRGTIRTANIQLLDISEDAEHETKRDERKRLALKSEPKSDRGSDLETGLPIIRLVVLVHQ
jgi:hypothetical protein